MENGDLYVLFIAQIHLYTRMVLSIFEKDAFYGHIVGCIFRVIRIDRGIEFYLKGFSDENIIKHFITQLMKRKFACI